MTSFYHLIGHYGSRVSGQLLVTEKVDLDIISPIYLTKTMIVLVEFKCSTGPSKYLVDACREASCYLGLDIYSLLDWDIIVT